ncbi:MAG: hypothetical protein AABY83_04210 [Pseudomonadota bacterium]
MKKWMLVVGLFAATAMISMAQADAVTSPKETQGLVASPVAGGTYTLVALTGPGLFVSAEVVKQGGDGSDMTFVGLEVDGVSMFNQSVIALSNVGLTQFNTYGVTLLKPSAAMRTVTIGFPMPMAYTKSLKLWVKVSESSVTQIIGRTISGH